MGEHSDPHHTFKIHFLASKEIILPEFHRKAKILSVDSSNGVICRGAVELLKLSDEIFAFLTKTCVLGLWWGAEGAATSEIRLSTHHRHVCFGQ